MADDFPNTPGCNTGNRGMQRLTMSTTNPRAAPMTVRSMALLVLMSVVYFVLVTKITGEPASADLRSLWLAGTFYPTGEIGSIYPLSDGVFSMSAPEIWVRTIQAEGIETAVYPFIYPPLWAWVMSLVVPITTMSELGRIMGIINPCLLILSALLAMRIAAPLMPRPLFFAIGLFIAATSLVFLLPLSENQPQIIVAFLTLLGVERARQGAGIAGGLAMALAASIKLYPALFALMWLAAGDRRAATSFALFGGALGLISIAVAGWPLHAAFLSEVSAISNTVLMLRSNLSLDSMIGLLTLPADAAQHGDTLATGGTTNWAFTPKPPLWAGLSIGLQLALLALLLLLARRTKLADPLIWPFAFTVVAWVSPLSWMYYFIAPFLFLPAIFDRLGTTWGAVALLLILAPTNYTLFLSGITADLVTVPFVVVNGAAILLAAVLFLFLALRNIEPTPLSR